MLRSPFLRTTCALMVGSFGFSARAATAAKTATLPLHELTYSGDQQALIALNEALQAAGKDPGRLGALEKTLLAEVARNNATFAARQSAAQRLGLVLGVASGPTSADTTKALATMLIDERDTDLARLALEPAAGPAVDLLFVQALPKASGRARIGIMDSIAQRRIASAVTALTPLLKEPDVAHARAAARALGEIGTAAALAALQGAPSELTAQARLAAAIRQPTADAVRVLRELQIDSGAPAAVRHAAFRTALDIDPASAATAIVEALSGADWSRKQVALEAIAASSAPTLVPSITGKLSTWDAPTQSGAIAALARRGDALAVPAVLKAATHSETEVRTAAITALGFLPGSTQTADALAGIAAGPQAEDARLARQSLTRLNGPGVSKFIVEGAEKGAPGRRVVFLEQIALRNLTEGLPLLIAAKNDPQASVRIAAVGALGDLAPVSEQRMLLDWTVSATDEAEQARALRSLVTVTLRNPATATRGQVVFDAIEKASADVALRLLPALARIGGNASADTAARLAIRHEAKLAEAAASALTRWSDGSAVPALANVAETAALPEVRDTAREGAIRYLERNRVAWTPETTQSVGQLLGSTSDATTRKQLLTLLQRANDKRALPLAEKLTTDSAVGPTAKATAEIIQANLAGAPKLRASGGSSSLRNIFDFSNGTRWSVPTEGDEWIEIDFRQRRPLSRLTLDQSTRDAEFPERYEVYITDDAARPGTVVASGAGQRGKTIVDLPAGTRGRYVIIKNVAARTDSNWSIVELYVD